MSQLAAGLMSGTSCDGLSIALGSFKPSSFELVAYQTYEYPAKLRNKILHAAQFQAPALSRLNMELGQFFAGKTWDFIKKTKISPQRISAIGSHGQTVYHGPKDSPRNTLQIGEGSFIAQQTGIPVVADFRPRDLAGGGQGAPLITFFDEYFFGKGELTALQNIGGIANVTLVGRGKRLKAFDNGPGNCLIDWAVQKRTRGKLKFDRNGKMARAGTIRLHAIKKMMRHSYFRKKPPKSTGRELFNESFLPVSLKRHDTEDLIATLTFFTAYMISQSYHHFFRSRPKRVIVSGGGALNETLMAHLRSLLRPVPVKSIESWGLHPQAKEPLAFAFLALRALQGKCNHSPEATGSRERAILGKIIPGRI